MPETGGSPTLTVKALLAQPTLLSRELVNLVYKRLIADRLFVRGSAEQVAGGAMRFQQLENIFVDDDPDEIAEGADFPLTDWTEVLKTEPVRQYGFGVRVTNLAIRRNQRDMVARGQRKLANRLVKFIDTKAMAVLEDAGAVNGVNTQTSAAVWTTAGTDIIAEIGKAQETIETQDNGYNGFEGATLILHTNLRDSLLNNTVLRAALPRETQSGQIQTGMLAPFLGLKEILFTPQITATKAILMDTSMAGTIADERPDPSEKFVAYDPGPGFAPIYVKIEDDGKPAVHKRVYAGRWPAIALPEPKAVVRIDTVA
jgi:hypothetical protein